MSDEAVELLREIRDLLRRQARPRRDEGKRLLTKAAFSRLSGLDLKTTLADAIATKAIKTVPGPRGVRIPHGELERLEREGLVIPKKKKASSTKATSTSSSSPGDAIRALKVP